MFSKKYSWRRLTLALAILAVIAFSAKLTLAEAIVTALLISFGQAVQFFFQQHKDEGRNDSTTP